MENLTYVTGNYGKYISVKEKFDNENIEIDYLKLDIDEPNINNIEFISKEKARIAFNHTQTPVFVIDTGFYIQNYPGNPNYPGAFVKRSDVANNIEKLLEDMKDVKDRTCYFLDCLTYYDGYEFRTFYGKCKGVISNYQRGNKLERAKSNLWLVFIPKNCNKTLAEMTDYERTNRNDDSTSATNEFISWIKNSKLILKK